MNGANAIAKCWIQPLLRSHGFRKNGHRWNRKRSDFVDVVTIQIASYSSKGNESFTVNLGVAVPDFVKIIWPKMTKRWLVDADCAVRCRLGRLQDKSLDQWWTISNGDHKLIGQEIHSVLDTKGIPFMEKVEDYISLVSCLRQEKGWHQKRPDTTVYLALAEWKVGNADSALQILDGLIGAGGWASIATAIRESIVKGAK